MLSLQGIKGVGEPLKEAGYREVFILMLRPPLVEQLRSKKKGVFKVKNWNFESLGCPVEFEVSSMFLSSELSTNPYNVGLAVEQR